MNRIQAAQQVRRALQILASTLSDEKVMEVPAVFDPWVTDKNYAAGDLFTYGENGVGDPQLYKVVQAHTSQADWMPDATPALYTAIGLDEEGYPVWSPPAGAHDAYNIGDIVDYSGILYESLINGNVTVPGTDERYWAIKEGNDESR